MCRVSSLNKVKRVAPYIWGALIFTLSSIPNFSPPGAQLPVVDKVAHFGEYLIFALLIFYNRKRIYVMPLVLLFAVADELHQKFIPGREVEVTDILSNFTGILFGWLLSRRIRDGSGG